MNTVRPGPAAALLPTEPSAIARPQRGVIAAAGASAKGSMVTVLLSNTLVADAADLGCQRAWSAGEVLLAKLFMECEIMACSIELQERLMG